MTELFSTVTAALGQAFAATVSQSPTPMVVIGAYAGGSALLYGLTRGREFLIAGLSSALFIAPFIRLG